MSKNYMQEIKSQNPGFRKMAHVFSTSVFADIAIPTRFVQHYIALLRIIFFAEL